jgi:hypothetical protein
VDENEDAQEEKECQRGDQEAEQRSPILSTMWKMKKFSTERIGCRGCGKGCDDWK